MLDAGHVISCINKLDIGSEEKIALCSTDSSDLLVVSYADIQRCLNSSFSDLNQQSDKANPQAYHELMR